MPSRVRVLIAMRGKELVNMFLNVAGARSSGTPAVARRARWFRACAPARASRCHQRARRALCLTIFCAQAAVIGGIGVISLGAVTKSERQMAEYLWAGVRAERERITSGVVRVTTRNIKPMSPDSEWSEPWTADLVFDRAIGKRLYHIDQPPDLGRSIWMRTEGGWYGWREGPQGPSGILCIEKLTSQERKQRFTSDFRLVGMAPPRCIEVGTTFERMHEIFTLESDLRSVDRESDGVYRLSWVKRGRSLEMLRSVVINESSGFTTDEYTTRNRALGDTSEWDSKPLSTHGKAVWEQRGGTWVPVTYVVKGGGRQITEFSFDWQSVNEPVAGDVFEVDKLGIPNGTLVVDDRLSPNESVSSARWVNLTTFHLPANRD